MNISHFGKTVAGIAVASLVLAACSGTAGTSTTTNTTTDQTAATSAPVASPQSYVPPTDAPTADAQATTQATTQATITPDATTKKPALSSKDDAASLNADLKNTAVSDESFN